MGDYGQRLLSQIWLKLNLPNGVQHAGTGRQASVPRYQSVDQDGDRHLQRQSPDANPACGPTDFHHPSGTYSSRYVMAT